MAHVGKNYRLLARRDLAINVGTYRVAYPLDYKIVLNMQTVSGSGDQYLLTDEPMPLTSDQWIDQPEWSSEDITQHGRTYRLEGFVEMFEDSEVLFSTVHASFVNAGTPVLEARCFRLTNSYGVMVANLGQPFQVISYDSAFWGGSLHGFSLALRAKVWSD